MRIAAAVCAAAVLLAPLTASAELSVTMHDGLVSVQATDVTVRQILDEWARVGQAKIVNVEGLAGGPVTLQLTNVPEAQALDILLRSAAGYLVVPRATPIPNAAHFDRIIVMPTSSPSRASAPTPAPVPQRPIPIQADDNGPPPAPPFAPQPVPNQPAGPVFNTFPAVIPQPQQAQPPAPFATPTPGAPSGVAAPGMIIPPPQPAVPGQAPPQGR